MTADWPLLATQKRASILASIPSRWVLPPSSIPSPSAQVDVTTYILQFLSAREREITECGADAIAARTCTGVWSAEEVVSAFCHRAAVAHQLVHCLHEVFFDAAITDAKALDAHFAAHHTPVGPLHGVPVSLKDQFHVRGVETTMGYVGWIGTFEGARGTGKERVFESEMVRELRAAGAVLFCKTSVPHTLMTGETVNNIIGYTQNPRNRHLSSGGSSGGEGALIGIKGSAVGFGTDIGGSIRIPAAFNGLYGLRPSSGRLPYEGMANSMDGQNSILSVVGPLAGNVASLRLVTKAVLAQKPWQHDPMVLEMPWRDAQEKDMARLLELGTRPVPAESKLAFGVIRTDGVVNPTPPVARALEMVVAAVRAAGHVVVEWAGPAHSVINEVGFKSWIFDGGADVRGAFGLSGEPMSKQVEMFQKLEREMTGSEIARTNVDLRRIRKEYLEYWNSTAGATGTGRAVDGILCPLAPWPAARPEGYSYYGYSTFVNALDYTSVAVPVTNVDKAVDVAVEGYVALGEQDRTAQEAYDAELYDGAHVGVQIVGRRLEEEKMLGIAEYVGGLIGR